MDTNREKTQSKLPLIAFFMIVIILFITNIFNINSWNEKIMIKGVGASGG